MLVIANSTNVTINNNAALLLLFDVQWKWIKNSTTVASVNVSTLLLLWNVQSYKDKGIANIKCNHIG
jgi:hypothetical protein